MQTSEVNESLIGKRASCVFTGIRAMGTIIGVVREYDELYPGRPLCSKGVKIKLDYPIQWGDDEYDEIESTSRVRDEVENLSKTHLID